MFEIDVTSNKDYFIILKEDGKEFVKVKKANNKLEDVKKHFGIEKEVQENATRAKNI